MNTIVSPSDTIVTLRTRAFSHEGLRTNRLRVELDGTVTVWDEVAGYYTICNSLTPSAIRRARKLAAQAREDEGVQS